MKSIKLFTILLGITTFLFSTTIASAAYFSSSEFLSLPKDKKIDESAFLSGQDLIIDSEINGDLFCAGKSVVINGNVKGDVICAAESIKINSIIDGNVRVAAKSVEINGTVTRNVLALSQSLVLANLSSVKGDLIFGVQSIDLRGRVGRDLAGAGENINITGSLLRNAKMTGSHITIIDPAKIGGNFEYFVDDNGVVLVDEKNVMGSIVKHEIDQKSSKEVSKKMSFLGHVSGKIYWLLSTLVLGLVMIYFMKQQITDRVKHASAKPLIAGLVGFAFLLLTPVAVIILLFTIVGSPLAIILLLIYVLSLMTAIIYPTIFLGQWGLKVLKQKTSGLVWPLITGLVIAGLLSLIPVVGGIAGFIMFLLGLGAIFLSYLPQK